MTLPELYAQNLVLHSAHPPRLHLYKLGLVEALLKEALGALDRSSPDEARAGLRQALEVVRWEPRPAPRK